MATLSSRLTGDAEQRFEIIELIEAISNATGNVRDCSEQSLQELKQLLYDDVHQISSNYVNIWSDNEMLRLKIDLMMLEIIELENLLKVTSKAIDYFLSGPPNDEALDQSAETLFDVLANTGKFNIDYNENLVLDDSQAKFNKNDLKNFLSVAIARWIEVKQTMPIS